MKRNYLTPVLLSSVALLAGSFSLNAATSDPVGAVSTSIVSGLQLVSVPFQKEIQYQGEVGGVAATVISLTNVPTLTLPAYVQVLDGTAVGAITNITAADSTSVTVESAISGLAATDLVAIRGHVTLGDVADYINAVELDLVTVYKPNGDAVIGEYYDGYGWYDSVADANIDSLPVAPGQGVALTANGARTATYYGAVSTSPVNTPYAGSNIVSLIGTLDPVAGNDIQTIFPSALELDLVTFYSPVGGALETTLIGEYYDGYGWYDSIGDANIDTAGIDPSGAVVYQSASAGSALQPSAYPVLVP